MSNYARRQLASEASELRISHFFITCHLLFELEYNIDFNLYL